MNRCGSLEYGVERFLARCLELASVEELNNLVKKGDIVTETEVANAVAELFLHPVYTIHLLGCFRQIAKRIIEEAIARLSHCNAITQLSRCNLNSDIDDMMEDKEDFSDEDVVHFIKHYDRNERGLKLHEFACLAFCRALDLDSSLWGSISVYFKFAPPPFERILREGSVIEPSKAAVHLLTLRVSYRLLLLEPKLSKLWDWSCFVDLVYQSSDVKLALNSDSDEIADIRWCCVQILSVLLKLGDKAIGNFGLGCEEAASCFLRWEEFCADVAIEKVASYIVPFEENKVETSGVSQEKGLNVVGLDSQNPLRLCEFEPTAKRRRYDKSAEIPFEVTSTVEKSYKMVCFAVSQKWPVLLYGPAGAGKTSLINNLARRTGNQVLLIHLDDQIDGKTLVGTYVSTERPGEFRWQHGSLIQAAVNGYWVVFEGIDKASSDVQSILLPLLEGASSFITGHGEEIQMAEGFRLFSTISTSKSDIHHRTEGGILLSTLWRKVMLGMSNYGDMERILKAWYPNLGPLTEKLIETFKKINHAAVHPFRDFESGNSASTSLCRFSLRDILKWCKRIAGLGFGTVGTLLTQYQYDCVYQEGVDIFAASMMSAETRLAIMEEIAKVWRPEAEVLRSSKPEIQVSPAELRIGRVILERLQISDSLHRQERLVQMRSSLHTLERIASSYKYNEPVLLVGETGTGKTTLVQNLAVILGQRLTVLNLSQQSDVADLLGGFKPVDPQSICLSLYKEFKDLLTSISLKVNDVALSKLQQRSSERNWKRLLQGLVKCVDSIRKELEKDRNGSGKKRKGILKKVELWENLSAKLETAKRQIGASSGMIFSFVEGAFVTALRNGEWILLDEVNLAPPETLQRVIGVLEGEYGSLCLAERGDISLVPRHPNFRIFACMNPATDAGKRDLPYSLRSRFTEYFVNDVLDKEDLKLFINRFMEESRANCKLEKNIIDFYEGARKCSEERLQDGANQKPQYSLRSLYRALEYIREAKGRFGFQKAVYDGFSMFFLTLLDRPSAKIMKKMIKDNLLEGKKPPPKQFDEYLRENKNSCCDEFLDNYVLTKSVTKQLGNLARAVFMKKYPVLLQGPTSSGKTSLVQYLASITGHKFVRINNHEHTDLQEYLGSYISDAQGKLVFHEGALVKAIRDGHWIVLDELNLAPSDVLEALNRLLDDNRELFVPELRETIRAHPNFMLFATQNPPTFYGGRKMLSRAFRNRFVEVHVEEIPDHELSTIIEKRCRIPGSRAKIMVKVMKDLQLQRQSSKVFAGKHGFITPRDLFRWANRLRTFGDSKEVMAEHGYYLLADRLRDEEERCVVQEVLEKHLRVRILRDDLYKESIERDLSKSVQEVAQSSGSVISTRSMTRLYSLVKQCYQLREPVLLVGETGGGKTTVCQLLSRILNSKLHILNCHQYTETSDFLGGFYPIRERSRLSSEFKYVIEKFKGSKAYTNFPENLEISSDIGRACSTLNQFGAMISKYRQGQVSCGVVTSEDLDTLEQMKIDLALLYQKWQTIFLWQDGPLVQAMKDGDLFLIDEISLADDSVLERLNSVLEPERKLSLAEKGGSDMEEVTAHEKFFLLATMNPGGDYGKKELSPALRNRFTEIWVPSVSDVDELRDIATKRLSNTEVPFIVDALAKFWEKFNELQAGRTLTVRDLLSWVEFINLTEGTLGTVYAFIHGIFLVLLDGLSLGTGFSRMEAAELRERCLSIILNQLELDNAELHRLSNMQNYGWGDLGTTGDFSGTEDMQCDNAFGISPFFIDKGNEKYEAGSFEFLAPTTRRNAMRVLRAMQLSKPVLLEGSPGVGKTSLITAMGKISGHKVVRINLCEQTDLMDLLGSDLPVDSDEGMKFAWSDGILLQALKEGCWVLLDELNLAPQSVLEGLNAILDHRAEIFIPELGRTFKCPTSFRVFACQNPLSQGGGRKGLPRSFLNRFTKVYVDELVEDDYLFICTSLYPSIPRTVLSKLILFNKRLHEDTMIYKKFAQDGSPWEFNLRDVIRSCQVIQDAHEKNKVEAFLNILYVQRMRTAADRKAVLRIYEDVFGYKPFINPYPRVHASPQYLTIGDAVVEKSNFQSSKIKQLNILPSIRQSLEAVAHCVQHQWLSILIGPPSSGKTSLIRLLAQLTGNVLYELHLSSTTDISELVGCFEQYNASRNLRFVVSQVERYVNEFCYLQLERSKVEFVSESEDLIKKWLTLSSRVDSSILSSSATNYLEDSRTIVDSLTLIAEVIEQLKLDASSSGLPISWSSKELNSIMNVILKLQEDQRRKPISAKFEWVSGVLIRAIENGDWIVLENANLCNPTVLDRINSLVEPSGSITVNECGIVDGNPLVLHPHPNFRIFLTVDPSYGEVSRAMRNRGVEVYMMQPHWLFEEENSYNCTDIELEDVKRFLVSSGVPIAKLVDSMSKAHTYARNEGLKFNVQITYLELARWVQLFQQLVISGNQPLWSLQESWEHTYLCSLGESWGCDIVNQAKAYYLSNELLECPSPVESPFCLPGGWPMPLKLKDFILYSRESVVKQNCMHLEYLVAQYGSGVPWNKDNLDQVLLSTGHVGACLMDRRTICKLVFPKASTCKKFCRIQESDRKSADKRLFFAASWTIEQATEVDYKLYLFRLRWFSSKLQRFCPFFYTFQSLLEQEIAHPIWRNIFDCHRELARFYHIDSNLGSMPLLSLSWANVMESDELSKANIRLLFNAINCIGLLRRSYHQWNIQNRYEYSKEALQFKPILESLQELENSVLSVLPKSPSYDLLIRLYDGLLEDHITFWDILISSKFENLVVCWRSLMKNVSKMRDFYPAAVENILEMAKSNVDKVFSLDTERSLLWIHGGHPIVPASAELYYKQHELLKRCESIWPTKADPNKQVDDSFVELAASANQNLRSLAVQGIGMSSYITAEYDDDSFQVVQKLEEMNQGLEERFESEKSQVAAQSDVLTVFEKNSVACCVYFPGILGRKSTFVSWYETLPIVDIASLFMDMELLHQLSSVIMLDPEGLQQVLSGVSDLLKYSLKYSLTCSSRPPQALTPHQKISWALEAWQPINAVNSRIVCYILEMWLAWHSSLWNHYPVFAERYSRLHGYDVQLVDMLIMPVRTSSIMHILRSAYGIKDYFGRCLQLRATTHNLWQSPSLGTNAPDFLISCARLLFQQIIYAHEKSFDADTFTEIMSIFKKNITMREDIKQLSRLILLSCHQGLKSSLPLFIDEPMLEELYLHGSTDLCSNVGHAWLRIGGLRFSLLLGSNSLDPGMKYSFKYSQLEKKIKSLSLEIKVRQECDYLAGLSPSREADEKRKEKLKNLNNELRRLRKKMVFRCNPSKFNVLWEECEGFLKRAWPVIDLVREIGPMEVGQVFDQVCNWQETATCFIDQLVDEYKDYIDVTQPILVAVYEMKLGFSLVLSGALQKKVLKTIEEDNIERVLESIYSFMNFPRGYLFKSINSNDLSIAKDFWNDEISVLEKLVPTPSHIDAEKTSLLQAKVHQNFLLHIAHFVTDSQKIDSISFESMDRIFHEFSCRWMNLKKQIKSEEGLDTQEYKFRPRAFEIKNVVDVDISSFGKLSSSDTFSEWQKLLSEEECVEKMDADDKQNFEEELNLTLEPILTNVISVHNQLFGSSNLVLSNGRFHTSNAEKLLSFSNCYTLGAGMVAGLGGLYSSTLDGRLMPEHLLSLCLEHEKVSSSPHKSSTNYNFYKDSNASEMVKMVKPLTNLQQMINGLLIDWDEHPGLLKIMDAVDMLLAIPISTPLAKALLGLQFLLNRVTSLQESGSKFSLSDLLEPINSLVCSWQKMEFDSWPALLDEVQDKYENNAAKLWFPLFSVLHHSHASDVAGYVQSTIQSLEEFMQTSSIGEFRKRLQLLFAFHGQITAGRCLEVETYLSDQQEENLKILYNLFGYYVQFLPRILEHINAKRRELEKELKELLKLCRWERIEACLHFENFKRTRHKLRKLIQKYTDLLQQPVMTILNQEVEHKGLRIQPLQGPMVINDLSKNNPKMFNDVLDLMELHDEDRSLWISDWRKRVNVSLLKLSSSAGLNFLGHEDVASSLKQFLVPDAVRILHQEQWDVVSQTLENIFRSIEDSDQLWRNTKRSIGKKRAFSELLKLLESSGLQKHYSEIMNMSKSSNRFFTEPSYDAEHLLPAESRLTCGASSVADASKLQCLPDKSLDTEWKIVNEYYFKCMASLQILQQICLKPHEDFTYEQVTRSVSFLNHLMVIQRTQRNAAYDFANHLKCLGESIAALENLRSNNGCDGGIGAELSSGRNQCAIFPCMWKQKKLFDALNAMMFEVSILLRTLESTHLNSCQNVKPEAAPFLQFIEEFAPVVRSSKDSLDKYLVSPCGLMQTVIQESHDKDLLGRVGAKSEGPFRPYIISNQMKQLVYNNFQVLKEFEGKLGRFRNGDLGRNSVAHALLGHLDDIFKKGNVLAEQLVSAIIAIDQSNTQEVHECKEKHSTVENELSEILKGTFVLILDVFKKLCSSSDECVDCEDKYLGTITTWEDLFESSTSNLNLEKIYASLLQSIFKMENLLGGSFSGTSHLSFEFASARDHLLVLLDLVLSFGESLLKDLLTIHKRTSAVTHVLAETLASLFSKGFGVKEGVDDNSEGVSKDASGTGMGEGSGLNDVSDQITDEDQLLGTSEKPDQDQDASGEIPDKNQKGIEMEQDFEADMVDVSEESGDDDDDDEDNEADQLESKMGEAGAESEAVDEKLWDKEEDEDTNNKNEKYESGPAVKDMDSSDRELRAKEESTATADDELGERGSEQHNEKNDEVGDQDDGDAEENLDDSMDKEEAFADPTGLKIEEPNESLMEDMEVDENSNENDTNDLKEEIEPEEGSDEFDDIGKHEEEHPAEAEETMEEAEAEAEANRDQVDRTSEESDPNKDSEQNPEANHMAPKKERVGQGISELNTDHVPNASSATQQNGISQEQEFRNAGMEMNMANSSEAYNDLANMPNGVTSEMDIMVSDTTDSRKFTDHQRTQLPQKGSSDVQKALPNPYRNVVDALKEWKERVKVSVDLQADNMEVPDEVEDDNANEYGFVSEFEKGTDQALGPATAEQIDANVNSEKPDKDLTSERDDVTEMEIAKQTSEEKHLERHSSIIQNRTGEQMPTSDFETLLKEVYPEVDVRRDGDPGMPTESLISVKKSFPSENLYQTRKTWEDDDDLGKALDFDKVSLDSRSDAGALWRRYELLTTRLSQELAEQLRLVLEPTVASKLQGDYKTGKRINMKRLLRYIASDFRQDKIWLRRTRPNKRDYQIVIAVDDSRSMSENSCGDVAIESLVAVCRAMSQLEMGNLAVTSFGKKGNIRLLHDFDHPFTGEAGMKIISSLTFKQENTIADEPVLDLLTYLKNMLNTAVANARLPSGQNPLQQLVLIIADGRFHEKEKLKCYARDFISQKRMVAFLLLDNPKESVVDQMEAYFVGEGTKKELKFKKYLDSFPFPYYIVLRNIEALPRTLADLLRQWFEVMQYSRE